MVWPTYEFLRTPYYNVGDTGWVVPPRDSEALANAIEKALLEMQGKPEAWQQRRSACRKHIEDNFSIEKMVEKYHVVWCSVSIK